MLSRALLPLLLVFAIPVQAQDTALCPLTDDAQNCVRVLACIGDQGRWFHGRSFGRGKGTLAGVTSDGVTCSGTWMSQNAVGLGQADVACDDGMSVTVLYFYQDEYSGTALGRGITNGEEVVQSWSGDHVIQYFKDGSPTKEAVLKCGSYDIPLS
jgi:hypothetical protein